MIRRYEALQDFFLGYFHPDWRLDAADRSEVVEAFLASNDSHTVKEVLRDLQDLLAEPLKEPELRSLVLERYSLFFDPAQEGITMRDWLEGLRLELERDESP